LDANGGIVTVSLAEVERHGVRMFGTRVDRLSPSGTLEWTRVHLCVPNGPGDGNTYSTVRVHVDAEVASVRLERGACLVALDAASTLRWTRPLALSSVDLPAYPSLAPSDDRLAVVHVRTLYDLAGSTREHGCPETGYVADLATRSLPRT
jgi:hypothetical protein